MIVVAVVFSAANGTYYARMWERAIMEDADMVSITSWNEWGEGTQIEPAIAREGNMYNNYESEGGPNAYIEKTRMLAGSFRESKRHREALTAARSEL